MVDKEDENAIPPEILRQLYENRTLPGEIDRRPRKPLTGYPFSLFGEDVNAPIRDFLYKRVKLSELKTFSKKEDNNSE
jgi:hypothetical protein